MDKKVKKAITGLLDDFCIKVDPKDVKEIYSGLSGIFDVQYNEYGYIYYTGYPIQKQMNIDNGFEKEVE